MTNITGKIYQMQNAAGTENRFPRTVMEAVLGLNTYLQQQFNALADIYMPIEGISEALTYQEFVYRISPNTIKAKSLTLDRILGRTLAWNQIFPGWRNGNKAISTSESKTLDQSNNYGTIGHKYFFAFDYWGSDFSGSALLRLLQVSTGSGIELTVTNSRAYYSCVYTCARTDTLNVNVVVNSGTFFIDNTLQVDLTLLYGSEIDGLTDAEILAKYEADFGTGYHENNAGELISNDAEELETVGLNQWDEEWELGRFNASNGQKVASTTNIRTKNHIPVFPNKTYSSCCKTGDTSVGYGLFFYDENKNLISRIDYSIKQDGSVLFTTPDNCRYICFDLTSSYGTTYNHDICINLSNPAINGQYFPYWKRTMQLGLTTKEDTDGNVPFADGMKGAGTAADWCDKVGGDKIMGKVKFSELRWSKSNAVMWTAIRNKKPGVNTMICSSYVYAADQAFSVEDKKITDSSVSNYLTWIFIKDADYTSSDIAAFLADHGNDEVVYPLDTPVPFTWAEPLINTVKAGTTEARISPNEGGLSAPFCCDITYSASENNDSESAQYAATAGRLLNTHKIWGQDFNGSEDVNGNLVSNGILQGTQLKSTVPTGTAPLVVSSTTTVENLVAEKASKLLTARTIWGQNFDGSGDISGAISNITTLSASGLATIAGGIALGTSTNAQAARLVWDETNNAWHLQGNLYADGSISAKGTINNNTDYVTQQQYNELISRIEALEG